MSQTLISSKSANENALYAGFSSLIIVLFLFYIDEGYFSFAWMKEWGNWVVFILYLILMFPIQWAVSRFAFGKVHGLAKGLCMVVIAIPLTLTLFFWLCS